MLGGVKIDASKRDGAYETVVSLMWCDYCYVLPQGGGQGTVLSPKYFYTTKEELT